MLPKNPFRIFQVFVAAQNFFPSAADVFQDHSARDHRARHRHLRRRLHAIHRQNLPRSVFRQIAVQQHLGFGTQRRFRGLLDLVRHGRRCWRNRRRAR